MNHFAKRLVRSRIKQDMLEVGQDELSGAALNLLADLPADAEMPREAFGL